MKIETVYTFEPGDIVQHTGYWTVAVRQNSSGFRQDTWTSNSKFSQDQSEFTDAEIRERLENGRWRYVGNVSELAEQEASK